MSDDPLRFDPDNDSIGDAQEWLNDYCPQGKICPCCDKPDKEYTNRSITKTMGQLLVAVCHKFEENPDSSEVGRSGSGWIEVPPLAAQLNDRGTGGGDFAKLRYPPWALVEQMPGLRADGSPRNGWYRPTADGQKFVRGLHTVIKYCHVWRGEWTGGSHGPQISINDIMGPNFCYERGPRPGDGPGENFHFDRLMGPPLDE